jgi:hypothetical protein
MSLNLKKIMLFVPVIFIFGMSLSFATPITCPTSFLCNGFGSSGGGGVCTASTSTKYFSPGGDGTNLKYGKHTYYFTGVKLHVWGQGESSFTTCRYSLNGHQSQSVVYASSDNFFKLWPSGSHWTLSNKIYSCSTDCSMKINP